MYIEIKNDKLISWCENPYMDYEFVDINYSTFDPEKYKIIKGKIVDITGTKEYLSKKQQEQKQADTKTLLAQIDELDKKRIRAICEPEVKNEATGQTWLEFYTEQIQMRRAELEDLK